MVDVICTGLQQSLVLNGSSEKLVLSLSTKLRRRVRLSEKEKRYDVDRKDSLGSLHITLWPLVCSLEALPECPDGKGQSFRRSTLQSWESLDLPRTARAGNGRERIHD